MAAKIILCTTLLFVSFVGLNARSEPLQTFKICVPHAILKECHEFIESVHTNAIINCVSGRDRMDCLEKVNLRQADFLFVDPEDMYVAYHLNNQDFSVFSEIRTNEEPTAEFRYEGIILVRKNSNIHSLNDLRGKKSCHTGYGRNVGYKIPITKLKKNGIFKVTNDPALSPVEKELKALSELFSSACLVGNYSPNPEVNQVLKKRYSNLCALCEHPEQCNYPDKYSGYEGSIRCLVENNGDVAFTKVIFVKKYFGLWPNVPKGNTNANADDYEYLCEDGTRKSITGEACSWAQRPWQGFMGNADVNTKLHRLQQSINSYYTAGKTSENKVGAAKLWIKDTLQVVDKEEPVLPGEHLIRAQYKDVIERDGTTQQKIRFCISSDLEAKKCDTMKRAAYSRDIRPEFQCVRKTKTECISGVHNNEADVVAISAPEYPLAREGHLKAILYEAYGPDDVYVAVVSKDTPDTTVRKSPIKFDPSNLRSVNAALYFNSKRERKVCPNVMTSEVSGAVKIVNSHNLEGFTADRFELVCPDFTRQPITEYKTCNFEFTIPAAVFSRSTLSTYELDNMIHAFTSLSDKFGHEGKIEEVFELFGEFEEGHKDVIFNDEADKFVTAGNYHSNVDEEHYKELRCEV